MNARQLPDFETPDNLVSLYYLRMHRNLHFKSWGKSFIRECKKKFNFIRFLKKCYQKHFQSLILNFVSKQKSKWESCSHQNRNNFKNLLISSLEDNIVFSGKFRQRYCCWISNDNRTWGHHVTKEHSGTKVISTTILMYEICRKNGFICIAISDFSIKFRKLLPLLEKSIYIC